MRPMVSPPSSRILPARLFANPIDSGEQPTCRLLERAPRAADAPRRNPGRRARRSPTARAPAIRPATPFCDPDIPPLTTAVGAVPCSRPGPATGQPFFDWATDDFALTAPESRGYPENRALSDYRH